MNKKILIGVMLSCFLLLVTPCINAIEYKQVKENFNLKINNEIENNKDKYDKLEVKTLIIQFLLYYYIFCYIITFLLLTNVSLGAWSYPMEPLEAFFASFIITFITMVFLPIFIWENFL